MDLEVVGRHALLFDDDSTAAFVNSGEALVDWNSLQIDRYDVRHLLSGPPPSRRRSQSSSSLVNSVDASIQLELDHERYLDLPSPSDEPGSIQLELDHVRYLDLPLPSNEPEVEEGEEPADAGAYRAVGFSYGNTDDFADRKSSEAQESSDFRPSFPVPESLLQCLPPTEKLHQIIARTALFVSKHGGQSEIVLRVKQGDNPTFGFLMPDHALHAYFRFLVDHPELLQSDSDLNTQGEGKNTSNEHKEHDGVGGALSMLGSVYGFGEDEEPANGDDPGSRVSSAPVDVSDISNISRPLERAESSSKAFENGVREKDEKVSTHSLRSGKDKEKTPAMKTNNLISASKSGSRRSTRKEDNSSSLAASKKTKLDISGLGAMTKPGPLVEPPSELKKLIDKIVEFILKNGKQFESTLMEQDSKHGRFPFLLPSNQYHPYYLKVLQRAQESKVHGSEKRSSLKGSDSTSLGSAENDLPYVYDKKEKFKMVIGKSKKETQDSSARASQQEVEVGVDAAAAAAILQAATRGIKKPNLSIISGSSKNGDSQGHSSDGAQASSFSNVPPRGPSIVGQKSDKRMEHSVSIPKVKEIAKSAAAEAAGEADSSEAHLSKEQKLKAERLRRAKMFVALLKGGAAPAKRDSLGGSVELQESAISGSVAETKVVTKEREGSAAPAELTAREREGSTAPLNNNMSNENEISEMKNTVEEHERRARRKYRSRSGMHKDEDEEEERQEEEEEEEQRSRKKRRSSRKDDEEESGEARDDKRSRKKRRSRRQRHRDSENADGDEDDEDTRRSRKKHRRRHSSPEDDDEQRDAERHHKHGRKKHSSHRSSRENRKDDYEGDHKHSKKKRKSHRSSHRSRDRHEHRTKDSSDDESDRSRRTSHHSKDRHKLRTKDSSDDEPEHNHKHASSSDDEEQRYDRADKNDKGTKEREELEEGEILAKVSDQSRGSLGGSVSREASVDVSSSQQRASSQPSESTEISDDLRAKIRAMLMATRT
ncbi:putative splicing factor, suppressor of white-apricot -like protein isoform X2 [Capsicum annuum]|nr:putative splicing factor, suppressor of white-apricot -like protein isoform X2 [Capsicum annuum]KAF3622936.1 putative splicing factor, suppressor of white-apricot -like protein isoform X2 [Capsicum annuum]